MFFLHGDINLPLYISCIFCFFMAFLFLHSHTTKIHRANHRVTPIILMRRPMNQGCFIKSSFSGPAMKHFHFDISLIHYLQNICTRPTNDVHTTGEQTIVFFNQLMHRGQHCIVFVMVKKLARMPFTEIGESSPSLIL